MRSPLLSRPGEPSWALRLSRAHTLAPPFEELVEKVARAGMSAAELGRLLDRGIYERWLQRAWSLRYRAACAAQRLAPFVDAGPPEQDHGQLG